MVEITDAIAKEIAETEQSQGIYAHCRQPSMLKEEIIQHGKNFY